MSQYKLTNDYYTGEGSTIIFGDLNIPRDPANTDYQQFIKDVAEQGFDIVEGPDVVQPSYADLRRADYPPISEQLDATTMGVALANAMLPVATLTSPPLK